LGIIDSDTVDLTNLQRQVLHSTEDVGRPKTQSAREAIAMINPDVKVLTYNERLTSENALDLFRDFDIVLDGSDNFPTKYLVNDACYFTGKPHVYGGVFQFEGQASVFHPKEGGPCLRCLFPEPPPPGLVPS
jgi:adenylyltransferase/sulfurtransferase